MREEENTLLEMKKAIDEGEWKAYGLPDEYFKEYFENEFLPELKSIYKKLKKV